MAQIKGYVRSGKAILQTDRNALDNYKMAKKRKEEETSIINTLKKDVEELFNVKVDRVRTLIRNNKKIAYVKLKKDFLAIDVATKLGMM